MEIMLNFLCRLIQTVLVVMSRSTYILIKGLGIHEENRECRGESRGGGGGGSAPAV